MMLEISTINAAFAMWAPILPAYGRRVDGSVVKIWHQVLVGSEVTDEEFRAVTETVLRKLTEFPTPADVINLVKKRRENLGWALHGETGGQIHTRLAGPCLEMPEPSDEQIEAIRARYSHLRSEPLVTSSAGQERVGFRQPTTEEIEAAKRKKAELKAQLAQEAQS